MRGRGTLCVSEQLERRQLWSAVPQAVLDGGAHPLEWQGGTAYAYPGRWIVQLRGVAGSAAQQLEQAGRQFAKANANFAAARHLGRDGLILLDAPRDLSPAEMQRSLGRFKNVEYVEPDFAVWSTAIPNDPSYPQLWGLENTGQTGGTPDADIDASAAWDLTTGGADLVVGVIDSGIDYKHPDLLANAWVNAAELNGRKNVDDDGNGYKDDVYGYDFINGDGDPMDDNGHGTHVAGTIAGTGNNGVGVTGVAWRAKVMALKFLGSNGSGPISAAAEALNYATAMRVMHGVNIQLTNNSWGSYSNSQAMEDALAANEQAGMLFVAAAGNDNAGTTYYPSRLPYDNIVTVGATDRFDAKASFSNHSNTNVDLSAPGVEIYSTLPRSTYGLKNGTSMAAPLASGVAALAWTYRPDATAAQVRAALLTGVDVIPGLAAAVSTSGRLNALGTLERLDATYATPAAPTGLTATAMTERRIDLTWDPNADPDVEGYDVLRSLDGGAFVQVAQVNVRAALYRVTTLVPGTPYAYQLVARNFLSVRSDPSAAAGATTLGVRPTLPAAPTHLTATSVSRSQINLAWTDNSTNENAFIVERSTDNLTWTLWAQTSPNATTYANTGLQRGVRYYYRVAASNEAGYSQYSNTASAVAGSSTGASAAPSAAGHGVFSASLVRLASTDSDELTLVEAVLA